MTEQKRGRLPPDENDNSAHSIESSTPGPHGNPLPVALDDWTLLAKALDAVDHEDDVFGVVGRGRKIDRIESKYREYAALRSKEPTE